MNKLDYVIEKLSPVAVSELSSYLKFYDFKNHVCTISTNYSLGSPNSGDNFVSFDLSTIDGVSYSDNSVLLNVAVPSDYAFNDLYVKLTCSNNRRFLVQSDLFEDVPSSVQKRIAKNDEIFLHVASSSSALKASRCYFKILIKYTY